MSNIINSKKVSVVLLILTILTVPVSAHVADFPDISDYHVDVYWPVLPLPDDWTLGEIGGITIDDQDNVWIIQRPGTLFLYERASAETPPIAICCTPAPPVIQFDPSGKVIRAWGGHGEGYDWPETEHGITVDYEGNVWIGGSRRGDGMVLKFTADGEFLMQIGHAGPSQGSRDPYQLGGPADMSVHEATNEIFVADGYANNRVIVFDADTGEFKRMWGAYGEPPTDEIIGAYDPEQPAARQFRNVHCIVVAEDGLVYVCDRDSNRVQVFQINGTFIEEWFFRGEHGLEGRGPGSAAHLAFWPDADQSVILLTDIPNSQVRFLRRDTGEVLGEFGRFGNYAGQLNRLHQAVADSKGNVYTAEAAGKRVQRFVRNEMPDSEPNKE